MRSGAFCAVAVLLAAATNPVRAQDWNDTRALTLVRRATDRRVQQLADSGLVDYQATAHGYVTFLAQLGEGFLELPRVVKADELALQVYWRAPNISKQRVVGRRDTTLLPTDIQYHTDHLGIVQNNFPAIIRIGGGDEVRDVPHPLSPIGLRQYEFALTDSLRISMPGRVIDVYEVKVRPIDDELPRAIGALYIDKATAQVVRMAFSFTKSSYLDKQLEDVFVVLENGLVGTRFWLPRHQEIEIRRGTTWLDYPVRGVIRGRWEISDYTINVAAPPISLAGPEITLAPKAELQQYAWPTGRLLDSLPAESRLPTPTEIRRVQDEARAMVRRQAERPRGLLAARGVSDFLRFDRNAGLSLGAGFSARLGSGLSLSGRGRRGFADETPRGTGELAWRDPRGYELAVFAMDDVREAGGVAERSALINSLAAQEFGSDFTDQHGVRGWGFRGSLVWASTRWTAAMSFDRPYDLGVHATPFARTFQPSFDADYHDGETISLTADRPVRAGWFGLEWRSRAEARVWMRPAVTCVYQDPTAFPDCKASAAVERGIIDLEAERNLGSSARLHSRAFAGMVSTNHFVRTQDLILLGGPISAPGYAFHELAGDRALSGQLGVALPAPFPGISLGRFGRMAGRASVMPHYSAVVIRSPKPTIARGSLFTPVDDPFTAHGTGVYQSAGVAIGLLNDLLQLDASRAFPKGRWRFSLDLSRPFWGIL